MPAPGFRPAFRTLLAAAAFSSLSNLPCLADDDQIQIRTMQQAGSNYAEAGGTFANQEVGTTSDGKQIGMKIVGLWGVGLITGTPPKSSSSINLKTDGQQQFVQIEPGPSNQSKLVRPDEISPVAAKALVLPTEISPIAAKALVLPISQKEGESDTSLSQLSVKGNLLGKQQGTECGATEIESAQTTMQAVPQPATAP